jgi:hypothetical protein
MALTLAILPGAAQNVGSAQQMLSLVASVTNSGASSVTLQSLVASDDYGPSTVGQPDFLTPGNPVGLGAPTILPGATSFFPFRVAWNMPTAAGPSPQAPGNAAAAAAAAVPSRSISNISLVSLSSDGTVATVTTSLPILSTLYPFPTAQGGAMQLSSGFNLINYLTSFA